jgi:hypothetical protein
VTLRIRGTALAAPSDAQGQFTLTGVPVGDAQPLVDGSTAQRPGTWPDLEFQLFTVPGADNSVGMPIYLLPLDTGHGLLVDETHGGTLTLPEVPGFSLTVTPNSAIFPDGTRRGTITVTPVHADKVPMIPNFGQQPRFIVTIQPPGVRFDPRRHHPSQRGRARPGEVTELYSFDHDMGSFVATGTATVSEDGLVLRSDPGTGIIKGGWHCGGNPATQGTTACCPDCKSCDPQTMKCKADPDQTPPKKCLGNNDSNPNKPRVEPTLAAYGITVELDESCMGECKKGKCEMPKTSDRWRPNLLMAGLQPALTSSATRPRPAARRRPGHAGLFPAITTRTCHQIYCSTTPPPGQDACGYSEPPSGTPIHRGRPRRTHVHGDNFSTTVGDHAVRLNGASSAQASTSPSVRPTCCCPTATSTAPTTRSTPATWPASRGSPAHAGARPRLCANEARAPSCRHRPFRVVVLGSAAGTAGRLHDDGGDPRPGVLGGRAVSGREQQDEASLRRGFFSPAALGRCFRVSLADLADPDRRVRGYEQAIAEMGSYLGSGDPTAFRPLDKLKAPALRQFDPAFNWPRVRAILDRDFPTVEAFRTWFEENKDYLYWSDEKHALVLDEAARAAGQPRIEVGAVQLDSEVYWFLQGVGNVVGATRRAVSARECTGPAVPAQPVLIPKDQLSDRKAREAGYRRAVEYLVGTFDTGPDRPPLPPQFASAVSDRLNALTQAGLSSAAAWRRWWNENKDRLQLPPDGTHLVAGGR